jgi:hypothetical protein
MLSTNLGLVIEIIGVVATILALLSEDLRRHKKVRYILVGVLLTLVIFVFYNLFTNSIKPTSNLPTSTPIVPQASSEIRFATEEPTLIPTYTSYPIYTPPFQPTRPPTIAFGICSDNLLPVQWHLEAIDNADEASIDFSNQYILKGKYGLRITYNLHGLTAQIGDRKNDSVVVFTQPDWYGISLANPNYGTNGLDGEQTINVPLSDFVELPNPDLQIVGGKPLDFNAPVSSIRARFWHSGHFIVDIISIEVCSSVQ